MLALGIDTSNYATSLAAVDTARQEVVCMLKQFLPVKQGELGLRQSEAVFHHTMALPALLSQMENTVGLQEVDVVAVSEKPRPMAGSYMPCFYAGIAFASAFAAGRGIKLVKTTHQQGHLAAALFGSGQPHLSGKPLLFFHISGGTTELLLTENYQVVEKLGSSLDLYAGQAVDRLGVLLGFEFPAGPQLSALAEQCEEAVSPRTSLKGCDCHLSGLQNQCEGLLKQGNTPAYVAKYCLTSIAKTVVGMVAAARKNYPGLPVLCAGGVMSSGTIRRYIEDRCGQVYFAPAEYSADNAAGVALIGAKEISNG